MANLVNSWNEWDPLEEVIVGTARGAADIGYEPGLARYHPPGSQGRIFAGGRVIETLQDEAERQLDALAALLADRGIVVRRPEPIDYGVGFGSPDWACGNGRAGACPRDTLLVVGDTIVEANMGHRARYFEYRAYRRLMMDYFRHGARWIAAPKPVLADALFAGMAEGPAILGDDEPVFEAACFVRMGRDIFWQPDMVSNAAGAAWLARALGSDIRIHTIRFAEESPLHIDTTLVPVRPGLALINPERPCLDDSLALFAANGWEMVPAPRSVRSTPPQPGAVSNWISMNLLMLDPHTAVVEAAETPTIALLESLGCTVVPLPFDRVYGFGGGLHCCTSDIRRAGTLQSWFPTLD
ncbi:MAG: hypothetical protein JWO25_3925 [Alphaproteobacteria bacterium]|nr:hypothetical protein [Alphaproteobacteria bacterium]